MFQLRCFSAALCGVLIMTGAVVAQAADIDQWVEKLQSANAQAKIEACQQLATLGPAAKAALPALIDALDAESSDVRAYAAHAIGQIGPAAVDAAPALIKRAVDKDLQVRREVRDALQAIDAPRELTRPLMLKTLKSASPADAAAALATLAELGEAIVPDLCEALGDTNACYWACLALADIGPKAKAAVPHLEKLLDSRDPDIRMQALITLGAIGAPAQQTAPKIVELLNGDPFESVRYAAAFALGSLGEREGATEALAKALGSEDEFLRVAGAWGLLRLAEEETPVVDKAVQAVIQGMQSQDPDVRGLAAQAMADDRISNAEVEAAMRKALEGIDDKLALENIADALASVGSKIVPACIRSLEEKRKLRPYAILVLIKLGPQAAEAVPALIMTLDDEDPELRREAAFGLGAIGERAAPAVPALIEKLEDPDAAVRHAACYALGKIGPQAARALRPLHAAMQSDDEFLRLAAVWASLKIAPDNPHLKKVAVPVLRRGLDHGADHVRAEVAGLLGDIGTVPAGAVDELKKLLEDPHPRVRQAAAEALERIQSAPK